MEEPVAKRRSSRAVPSTTVPMHVTAATSVERFGYTFRDPSAPFIVARSSRPDAGRGLFATRDIPKDTAITFYDGELLPLSESKTRQPSYMIPLHEVPFEVDGLRDPLIRRGAASMCNENTGHANAVLKLREEILVLVAMRDIRANEEIYMDYPVKYRKREQTWTDSQLTPAIKPPMDFAGMDSDEEDTPVGWREADKAHPLPENSGIVRPKTLSLTNKQLDELFLEEFYGAPFHPFEKPFFTVGESLLPMQAVGLFATHDLVEGTIVTWYESCTPAMIMRALTFKHPFVLRRRDSHEFNCSVVNDDVTGRPVIRTSCAIPVGTELSVKPRRAFHLQPLSDAVVEAGLFERPPHKNGPTPTIHVRRLFTTLANDRRLVNAEFDSTLTARGYRDLAHVLKRAIQLQRLAIRDPGMTDEDVVNLMRAVRERPTLAELDLRGCNLSTKNIQLIESVLKELPSIKFIIDYTIE